MKDDVKNKSVLRAKIGDIEKQRSRKMAELDKEGERLRKEHPNDHKLHEQHWWKYGDVEHETYSDIAKLFGVDTDSDLDTDYGAWGMSVDYMVNQERKKGNNNFDRYDAYKQLTDEIKAKQNKTNNAKEQDMTLIRELKKLISKVENNKGEQEMDEKEKVDNENVDKRKLIDEVGGILKGKVDEEVWRTVIGKLEKLSYDKSEAGSADNKKVKNEDDDKEVDNEDEKDKKEVAEVKKDVKEDVENKCKNSKSTFDKINAIYNSVKQLEQPEKFVSRQDKLDCAVAYFK